MSYRDMLRQPFQPGQQAPEVRIDQADFFEFCRGLNQQQLKTPTGVTFEIKKTQPDVIITLRNHQERIIRGADLGNLLVDFEQNQSWHYQDYETTPGTATYGLALLRAYIDWHLLPRTMDALQTLQAKLQEAERRSDADRAESEKSVQAVQGELQTLRDELKAVVVQCPNPQCRRNNLGELVYCEGCSTELSPSNRFCAICGQGIPAKGNFCPQCGGRLV